MKDVCRSLGAAYRRIGVVAMEAVGRARPAEHWLPPGTSSPIETPTDE